MYKYIYTKIKGDNLIRIKSKKSHYANHNKVAFIKNELLIILDYLEDNNLLRITVKKIMFNTYSSRLVCHGSGTEVTRCHPNDDIKSMLRSIYEYGNELLAPLLDYLQENNLITQKGMLLLNA